jgi:cobalt-zinc-cadmium efflux system outer membrane protein
MIQKAILAFCTCLVSSFAVAQTDAVQTILQKIEQNNVELKGFDKYIEGKTLALKSTNVLPNPEVGAYYLPFGNSASGNYTEVQVSQSFEFPTVYKSRRELIAAQETQLGLEYEQKRQQILLQSKKAILEVIAHNKLEVVKSRRLNQAKTLFEQNQKLFDKGQIGILELNKAKVTYVKLQFRLQQIQAEKQGSLIILINLNGGDSIQIAQLDFEKDFLLPNKDSIWEEKLAFSPAIKIYAQAEKVANQQINLSKMKSLPDLTVGYNYQGFLGDNVSGSYAGVSIPIWGNKLRKNAAQANFSYSTSNTTIQTQALKSEFESQFNKYNTLLKMYDEYNSTLQALNSEELLLKAYQLGEISFSEYFIELEFYHNAYDALLEMEKELHLTISDILNHKL